MSWPTAHPPRARDSHPEARCRASSAHGEGETPLEERCEAVRPRVSKFGELPDLIRDVRLRSGRSGHRLAWRVTGGDDKRHDRAPETLCVLMAKPERDLPAAGLDHHPVLLDVHARHAPDRDDLVILGGARHAETTAWLLARVQFVCGGEPPQPAPSIWPKLSIRRSSVGRGRQGSNLRP